MRKLFMSNGQALHLLLNFPPTVPSSCSLFTCFLFILTPSPGSSKPSNTAGFKFQDPLQVTWLCPFSLLFLLSCFLRAHSLVPTVYPCLCSWICFSIIVSISISSTDSFCPATAVEALLCGCLTGGAMKS